MILTDAHGRITTWNSGAAKLFGRAEDEAVGQPLAVLFTDEDRAAGAPEQELATAERDGAASDDRWQMRKDGTRFWANGVTTALRDALSALHGFAKVLRDNTRRMERRPSASGCSPRPRRRATRRTDSAGRVGPRRARGRLRVAADPAVGEPRVEAVEREDRGAAEREFEERRRTARQGRERHASAEDQHQPLGGRRHRRGHTSDATGSARP